MHAVKPWLWYVPPPGKSALYKYMFALAAQRSAAQSLPVSVTAVCPLSQPVVCCCPLGTRVFGTQWFGDR